jgi:hypothetical protein
MAEIYYETLASDNFSSTSLDGFIRHQEVTQCWMRIISLPPNSVASVVV